MSDAQKTAKVWKSILIMNNFLEIISECECELYPHPPHPQKTTNKQKSCKIKTAKCSFPVHRKNFSKNLQEDVSN